MIKNDRCQWTPTLALEKPIYPGSTIAEYGMAVMRVNNAGVESVQAVAGGGTEAFLGVALPDSRPTATRMIVETAVVPSSAPRTVTLAHANLVAISVFDASGNLLTGGGTHYSVVLATGVVTFVDGTYSGTTCTFKYRYTMTATEVAQVYGTRPVGFAASVGQSSVTVVTGPAEIFTDLIDMAVDYVIGTSVLYTKATGLITSSSAGGPQNLSTGYGAAVIESPNINSPFLGFRYRT